MKNILLLLILIICQNFKYIQAQENILTEIDFYNQFIDKFIPGDFEKISIMHVRKMTAKESNAYAYAISVLDAKYSIPYVNPKFMFEYKGNLVLIKTDMKISELPFDFNVMEYSEDHDSIKQLWDYGSDEQPPNAAFTYCYVFYQFDKNLTQFWIGKLEDIPRPLDFYTNEDIYRVEGKWPEFPPKAIR